MSLGKTRVWVIVSLLLMLLTAQTAMVEQWLLVAQSRCGDTELCAMFAQFRPVYMQPLLFGLTLLAVTTTAARRLPAIGASAAWSLLFLMLCLMSFGAIQALGDDPASIAQAMGPTVVLAALLGFLVLCPDTPHRGYKTTLSVVAWCAVWATTGVTILAHLASLAEPLQALPQTTGLAAPAEALLSQVQGPLAAAQSLVPMPVDTVILAALTVSLMALLFRKRSRTARLA